VEILGTVWRQERIMTTQSLASPYVAVNPCRLCAPLGACLALKGFERAMPIIHGSQGCATYIRRYAISHYREPIDIASSSFDEQASVFGGGENLRRAIGNVIRQYGPSIIGIVSNCLSETIGDDISHSVQTLIDDPAIPPLAIVSAPSYCGGYEEGYFKAVAAVLQATARPGMTVCEEKIAFLPPLISPADVRELAALCRHMGVDPLIAPDISTSLDGGAWSQYHRLPPGGLPISDLRAIGSVKAVVDIGAGDVLSPAAEFLKNHFGKTVLRCGLPVGIDGTDAFCAMLKSFSGKNVSSDVKALRERAVDAYFDGHKYVAGKRAVIVGDEESCAALALWCREVGMTPALIAPTGQGRKFGRWFANASFAVADGNTVILHDADFDTITSAAKPLAVDICFGSGKAYGMAHELDVPLIRTGFPVHDRFGATRLLTLGYGGTMEFFDRVVNAFIEKKQAGAPGGYSYL
jgi:nitrogenase molybdenum-iron protein NifN